MAQVGATGTSQNIHEISFLLSLNSTIHGFMIKIEGRWLKSCRFYPKKRDLPSLEPLSKEQKSLSYPLDYQAPRLGVERKSGSSRTTEIQKMSKRDVFPEKKLDLSSLEPPFRHLRLEIIFPTLWTNGSV